MGVSCSHDRLEETGELVGEYTGIFLKHTIMKKKCLDCGKLVRVDAKTGRLTNLNYAVDNIEDRKPFGCSHKHWKVDETNITKGKDETFGGSMLRLFMGPAVDGIQYHSYLVAVGTCMECDFKFKVRAEYDTKWKDLKQVEDRTSDWKPMTIEQSTDEKVYKTVFAPA